MLFGNESQFERYYGFYSASFTIENYLRNGNAFLSYTIPGKQVSIYPMKENKLTSLFNFSSALKFSYAHHEIDTQKQMLRHAFSHLGWECPSLLAKLDAAGDFYFDAVSQIKWIIGPKVESHW